MIAKDRSQHQNQSKSDDLNDSSAIQKHREQLQRSLKETQQQRILKSALTQIQQSASYLNNNSSIDVVSLYDYVLPIYTG